MTSEQMYEKYCEMHPDLVNSIVSYEPTPNGKGIKIFFENFEGKTSEVDYCTVKPVEPDMVNHPPHYQSKSGLEAIDVIESFTADLKGPEATNTGNVLKYMLRWKSKNGLQDLKKALWYLKRLINHVEKEIDPS